MKKILEKIKKSLVIKGYDGCEIDTFPIAPDKKQLEKLAENFPIDSIKLLLDQEGYYFNWRWSDPDWAGLNAVGRIHWPGLKRILSGDHATRLNPYGQGHEGLLWTTNYSKGWKQEFESYLLVDDLGFGNGVLLSPNNEELYLWLYNWAAFELDLGLKDYFEMALQFKGLYLWQVHFITNIDTFPSELFTNHQFLIPRLMPELSEFVRNSPSPKYLLIAKEKQYQKRMENLDERRLDISIDYEDCDGTRMASLQVINKIFLEYGSILTDEMLAYFASVGTTSFKRWACKLKNGSSATINYFLYGLSDIFTGHRQPFSKGIEWDYNTFKFMNFGDDERDDPAYEELERMWTFYWEDGYQVALRRATETGKLEMVWSWDIPDFIPLQVDFETFIEAFLACGGLQSWVFHLEKEAPPYKLVPFEEPLKEIFPSADTSLFHFHS
jgi:hypothetical protein